MHSKIVVRVLVALGLLACTIIVVVWMDQNAVERVSHESADELLARVQSAHGAASVIAVHGYAYEHLRTGHNGNMSP